MLIALVLLSFLSAFSQAQACTTDDCTASCAEIALIFTHCNYDFTPNDNIQTCLCDYTYGLKGNLDRLNRCVACNQAGIITTPTLEQLQVQEIICAKYVSEGESAALSAAAAPTSEAIAAFSATSLPQIQSIYCSSGGPSPATTSIVSSTATTIHPSPTSNRASAGISELAPDLGFMGSLVSFMFAML